MLLPLLLLLLITILILIYVIYKPPSLLIRYFQHCWPDVLWHVPITHKLVALTIDDSPSVYTQEILSILQANDATATFFIIGSQVLESDDHKTILSDVVSAQNELGNHAMFDEPSHRLDDDVLRAQIQEVQSMICEAYANSTKHFSRPASTNHADIAANKPTSHEEPTAKPEIKHPLYFRPGSGFFSSRMRALLKELNYRLVLGSVYPHDAQIPYWRLNASHILGSVRPGSIIICHDRRSWTAPMLRRLLPELKRRGYRIVTVSELVRSTSG